MLVSSIISLLISIPNIIQKIGYRGICFEEQSTMPLNRLLKVQGPRSNARRSAGGRGIMWA